jgi:3-oxoadipate enol-lactonase
MAAGIEPAIARLFPPAFVAAHPDVVDGRRRSLAELDPAVFSGACDALSNLDLSADLAKIRCRTLVIGRRA